MAESIAGFRDRKDSIGGSVTCVIRNCPVGLGEPVFDKMEAMLAHAMLSIPSTKGFEIGSGFGGRWLLTLWTTTMYGRADFRDPVRIRDTRLNPQ